MISKEPWVVEKSLYEDSGTFNIVSVFHDKVVGIAYQKEDAVLLSKSVEMLRLLRTLSINNEWLNEDYFLDTDSDAEDWLDAVDELLGTITNTKEG